MKPLGLLGGTFDPVHHGHLRLAIEVREALGLDTVHLVPARLPALREPPRSRPDQRLAMLQIAVAGTGLEIDARELAHAGPSYTIDTLTTVRTERAGQPLCFILGQDAFNGLAGWHRWRELLDFAHLVVATRPGYDGPGDPEVRALFARAAVTDAAALAAKPHGAILPCPIPLLPIAATDLRARVRAGRSLAGLTPPGVADYIVSRNLYT